MQTSGHAFFNLAVRYEDETAANYGHMHTVAPMILHCSPVWQDRVHTTGSEQSVKRKPSDAVCFDAARGKHGNTSLAFGKGRQNVMSSKVRKIEFRNIFRIKKSRHG